MRVAGELEWRRQAAPAWRGEAAFRDQPVERFTGARRWAQLSDGPVAVGHDQALSLVDKTKVLAQVLPQLSYAYGRHVHKGSRSLFASSGAPASSRSCNASVFTPTGDRRSACAASLTGRILIVGGRDAAGKVQDQALTFTPAP